MGHAINSGDVGTSSQQRREKIKINIGMRIYYGEKCDKKLLARFSYIEIVEF